MRELWQPRLMDRRPYGQWEEKRDGSRDWAREQAQKTLREHQPDPLEPKLIAELNRLIASVETA
jgi:trimethylamine:corrinoid methyltransferase-like protein